MWRWSCARDELGLEECWADHAHKSRADVVRVQQEKRGAGKGIVHGALQRVVAQHNKEGVLCGDEDEEDDAALTLG